MSTLAVATLAGSFFLTTQVRAESSSLSIEPKKNYVIEPGKSVNDKMTIRNLDAKSELRLSLRVVDFSYTDESGTPKLMLAENSPQTTWSLKPYLKVPESVTIPASSSKTLDIGVSIPAGQGAGSYYSAIVYSSSAGTGGNVGLSASGVTLVFANVPGKVNEDLQIKNLGVVDGKAVRNSTSAYKFMTDQEPQNIGFTLLNNGNVAESPVGSITLHNLLFGRKTTIDTINPVGLLALRGQTRFFAPCIKMKSQNVDFQGTQTQAADCVSPGLWPGLYRASIDLFYGQNGNPTQERTKSVFFLYMPLWFVLVSLAVLALAAYFIWKLVRTLRRKFGKTNKK